MSSTLYWEPEVSNHKYFSSAIKFALHERWKDTCIGYIDIMLDEGDIEFFRGLRCAGVDGAAEVIEKITAFGSIHVYEK